MRVYKALKKQEFKTGHYCLTPIRHEDRFEIMKWRNEQIYHLRQSEPLTIEKQDSYFNNTIAPLFDQEKPNQILFSFLRGNEFIGYGGLVHINWIDKNAEISFIMNTEHEAKYFETNWYYYLQLIERVAFEELCLHKITTYAYDLRVHLYPIFEKMGFLEEARLRDHVLIDGIYKNVVIHSKLEPLK